jgi:GT2 family glycosyltransferase/glycosyltransferase involved in cell wall biosynthesis
LKTEHLPAVAVVVHYDGCVSSTSTTIGSLAEQDIVPSVVVLAGAGAKEFSRSFDFRKYPVKIEVVEAEKDAGRAGAYNAGIGRALESGAECILLLQGGLVADRALLSSLQEVSLKLGNYVVVGARIFSQKEPWKVLSGDMRWDPAEYTWLPLRYAEIMTEEPLVLADSVEFLSGSAIFFSREVIDRAGLFDPRFTSCLEDIDWCAKARAVGFRCVAASKAKVWADEKQYGLSRETAEAAYLMSRNRFIWAGKYLKNADRRQFYWGALSKTIKKELFSAGFRVPRSGSGNVVRRLYWAGIKYARDIGAGLSDEICRARLRGMWAGLRGGKQSQEGSCRLWKEWQIDPMAERGRLADRLADKGKLRILFLSHIFPYPLDCGAHLRVHHIMQALAKIGRVDWIGYTSEGGEGALPGRDDMDEISEICATAQVLRDPPRAGRGEGSLWHIAFSGKPTRYTTYPALPLMHKAAALAEEADLIWVESLHLAHWFSAHGNKMVVDVNDLESVKAERQICLNPSSLTKWAKRMDIRRLGMAEKEAVYKYSRLAVCSEHDRTFWPSAKERVWVVPNGVADRLFDVPESRKIPCRLVYVGTLDYAPNEDAVVYFCENILPLIAQEVSDVTLCVVGKNPPKSLRSLHDGKQVQLVGRVPDVVPYVQQAAVSIVPLRVGGGTRIKILESLALGTPVVSTTIGAEGLYLEAGRHLLLGDDPESFASAVIRLLKNEDLRSELSVAGRDRAKALYAWSSIQAMLAQRVREWWGEHGLSGAAGEKLMLPSSTTQHVRLMDKVNG